MTADQSGMLLKCTIWTKRKRVGPRVPRVLVVDDYADTADAISMVLALDGFDAQVAYRGNAANYGAANDPMEGGKIGGINVFGGGFALYNSQRQLVGGLGVSGDSSCADHNIGWKTRHFLLLDYVPAGVSGDPARPDNIVYDIAPQAGQQEGTSPSGWGHPTCSAAATAIAATLPATRKHWE